MEKNLRTNRENLVIMKIQGMPSYPEHAARYMVGSDGNVHLLPGSGGIAVNVHIGDPAFGWAADHLEPGASLVADGKDRQSAVNAAFNFYACVGNVAKVLSGKAEGAEGVVLGHHGGSERVIVDFPADVLQKLAYDDKVSIESCGQGLRFLDFPMVRVTNCDPRLLDMWGVRQCDDKIHIPVVAKVPGYLMGSGVGSTDMGKSDYDIMTTDKAEIERLGLNNLRFGDFVAIIDHDNRYGRSWNKGAITIGIIIHSDCVLAGHGPGVTTLFSCAEPDILVPILDSAANLHRAY